MNDYHAMILDDFIGQNWHQFINFIKSNHAEDDEERAEEEAEAIASALSAYIN